MPRHDKNDKSRLPALWRLTWPAIIEQLLGMMVSFVDTAMVGARNREAARAYGRLSGLLGFGMCLATGGLLFLLAAPIAAIFTPDQAVIAENAKVLRIVAFAEPFFAASIVLSGALRGARDCTFPHVCGPGLYVGDSGGAGVCPDLWLRLGA